MSTKQISVKIAKDGRKMNPNSLRNLKPPYPKGVSGNANSGNGYSLTSELKHTLRNRELRKQIVASAIEGAILREPAPFKEVWERVDGKVPENTLPLRNLNIVFVIGKGYQEAGSGLIGSDSSDPGS